mmetsp:Transcript_20462/g.60896  ORF Transcript_20462/g.60896 Transcript_20462/m.60896 type:complete len:167 (-) Transcript_20462:1680-2180(-)
MATLLRRAAWAVASPFVAAGRGYDGLARRYPKSTAIITTTAKTSVADAFAQLVSCWALAASQLRCGPGTRGDRSGKKRAAPAAVVDTGSPAMACTQDARVCPVGAEDGLCQAASPRRARALAANSVQLGLWQAAEPKLSSACRLPVLPLSLMHQLMLMLLLLLMMI